jgi:hypothetical protein
MKGWRGCEPCGIASEAIKIAVEVHGHTQLLDSDLVRYDLECAVEEFMHRDFLQVQLELVSKRESERGAKGQVSVRL